MPRNERTDIHNENGYGDLVIMSIETFDAMLQNQSPMRLSRKLAGYTSDNQLVDAREALSKIKAKHFGK